MKSRACLLLAMLPVVSGVFAAEPFVESDFVWNEAMSLRKQVIIDGVNQIARENPDCAVIDPASVRLDMDHGNPDYPSFAVSCGTGEKKTTVFFSELDIKHKPASRKRQEQH